MNDRFRENPDGILTDTEKQIEWLPKDSYLDLGCWRNWKDANAYVMLMNSVYAGGHGNWRLPNIWHRFIEMPSQSLNLRIL